ncbi:substrate-binding domain-containing protein [Pseudofrankia asymbiotica]|uniref:substrate-binding domain-containing protein n=1 Tax=Pseudofrankia asymbiotica TaxID=1834516 RepID=UPI001F51A4B1|nr:substrate-binding domain-containing protein [Pseudofrankia asymbiotica]
MKVGLVTSSETNPFALKLTDGAERAALAHGATLMTAAGRFDGDAASLVTAIKTMIDSEVDGILISPIPDAAVVGALQNARAAGIPVIALGSSTDLGTAVDAVFGIDNFRAGLAVGEYARATLGGRSPVVAMLDPASGGRPGVQRENGFLAGLGLVDVDSGATERATAAGVVCGEPAPDPPATAAPATAAPATAVTPATACLAAHPQVNVVFAGSDEAALDAHTSIQAAGGRDVVVVSADGGCAGVRAVSEGWAAATSQQYPRTMARQGVEAVVASVRDGKNVSGFHDTGVTLIAATPRSGVRSADVATGLSDCWG